MLFAFTLYRAILDHRNGMIAGYPNSRFLAVLYRDGFYYFATVGAVHVWNAFEVSTCNFPRRPFLEMCSSHCLPIVSLGAAERHVHGCLLHMGGDDGDEQ
jgi:hypothetical protein